MANSGSGSFGSPLEVPSDEIQEQHQNGDNLSETKTCYLSMFTMVISVRVVVNVPNLLVGGGCSG